MELWIRSQDKKNLIKITNQIGLNPANKSIIIANYYPDFIGTQGDYYERLGIYPTKERALEILDEIQIGIIYGGSPAEEIKQILEEKNKKVKATLLFNTETNVCLYEMPEE